MNFRVKLYFILGSLNAALCVGLGAFGTHFLKEKLSEKLLLTFQTGVQYHFYHALGFFALAFAAHLLPESPLLKWAGRSMLTGIVLFSGSLYLLSITGIKWIGAITPLGGLAFITAWTLLAITAIKIKSSTD